MRSIIFSLALLILLLVEAPAQTASFSLPDQKAILAVLDAQTKAWNAGNIDQFMQGYWRSDSLQFIGSKGITQGWKATLERYKTSYPDLATMGTLRFDILRVELLGKNSAFVVGKFHLTRPQKGDAQGYFTLLWRKVAGKWVITTDHTS